MTPLERARDALASIRRSPGTWPAYNRAEASVSGAIAEAEARGRAAGLEEAAKAAAEIQVERPGVVWMQACGAVKERIRTLADPPPAVKE